MSEGYIEEVQLEIQVLRPIIKVSFALQALAYFNFNSNNLVPLSQYRSTYCSLGGLLTV